MKRRKKLPSLRTLRDKLDSLFAKWVKLSAADENGYTQCVSCGKVEHWQDMDAGHFIPRASMATRWDQRNVHPQCKRCNRFSVDHYIGYTLWMQEYYGQAVVDELRAQKSVPFIMRRSDYEDMIADIAGRLAELADGYVRESQGTRWALEHCS